MLDNLSDMVLRGQAIQVNLEPLEPLEALVAEAQEWRESAATVFLVKNSPFTLLEVKLHPLKMNSNPFRFPRFSLL